MSRFRYFVIYKPFQTLSQFSPEPGKKTLKDWFSVPGDVYPVGRLDFDSEGLLLLTNDPSVNRRLLHPKNAHRRTYLAQVDGPVSETQLSELTTGVRISVQGKTHWGRATEVSLLLAEPALPPRNPPIRFRKTVPAPWIRLTLTEGKNRQVRKMCAAVGAPVLRLVRVAMESLDISDWQAGQIREYPAAEIKKLLRL